MRKVNFKASKKFDKNILKDCLEALDVCLNGGRTRTQGPLIVDRHIRLLPSEGVRLCAKHKGPTA